METSFLGSKVNLDSPYIEGAIVYFLISKNSLTFYFSYSLISVKVPLKPNIKSYFLGISAF